MKPKPSKVTGIILAGGKSTRMGEDKAFVALSGIPLIKVMIDKLSGIFDDLIVVANNKDPYKKYSIKTISDIIKDRGPLGGIYTGLISSDTMFNFVCACDMPFINLNLVKYMLNLKDGFDAVVPRLKKGYEPLFALYSKNCILPMRDILNSDNLRIARLFKKIKLKEVSEKEITRFGDPDILLANINTKDELVMFEHMKGDVVCLRQNRKI